MRYGSRALMTAVAVADLLVGACAELPRDPENGLLRIRAEHRLRVGLLEQPPFVLRTPAGPAGAEVEAVRELARELGAAPEWFWGSEQEHFQALEQHELDIVVGGISDETPWFGRIGLTRAYLEVPVVVAVPPSMPLTDDIDGIPVGVRSGDALAHEIARNGGVPVRVRDIARMKGAVAVPLWEVRRLGKVASRVELVTRRIVVAVPPGENGWLRYLAGFLERHRGNIYRTLETEEARP